MQTENCCSQCQQWREANQFFNARKHFDAKNDATNCLHEAFGDPAKWDKICGHCMANVMGDQGFCKFCRTFVPQQECMASEDVCVECSPISAEEHKAREWYAVRTTFWDEMERLNHKCGHCGYSENDANLKICAKCRAERYCDAECQNQHWSTHKAHCKALGRVRKLYKTKIGCPSCKRTVSQLDISVVQGICLRCVQADRMAKESSGESGNFAIGDKLIDLGGFESFVLKFGKCRQEDDSFLPGALIRQQVGVHSFWCSLRALGKDYDAY